MRHERKVIATGFHKNGDEFGQSLPSGMQHLPVSVRSKLSADHGIQSSVRPAWEYWAVPESLYFPVDVFGLGKAPVLLVHKMGRPRGLGGSWVLYRIAPV